MPVDSLATAQEQRYGRFRRRAHPEDIERLSPLVHEFINMHGGYYFSLTEEVQRGEPQRPARRNSGAVIAPGRGENTRFSFHCYSDPNPSYLLNGACVLCYKD